MTVKDMTVKDMKEICRFFGRNAEIILNNAKVGGYNDWFYDCVTLDESKNPHDMLDNNVVTFYFASGYDTISHPVNLVVLNHSPDLIIGRFAQEFA